jgi:hypothetical protein
MQQFSSLLSWRLFTAQHVLGVFPPIIRSSMTAVADSGFTTAVNELVIMDGKTPETCWAVNKRQDNKLENCCIWLVIYLNCTMMHGLTNLKLKKKNIYLQCFKNPEALNMTVPWSFKTAAIIRHMPENLNPRLFKSFVCPLPNSIRTSLRVII